MSEEIEAVIRAEQERSDREVAGYLPEFLLARYAEELDTLRHVLGVLVALPHRPGGVSLNGRDVYMPARVLADVKAKRGIVVLHFPRSTGRICNEDEDLYPCEHLRLLASVYSDHPDFRPEWAL